mgnify:CR=1 FL=1
MSWFKSKRGDDGWLTVRSVMDVPAEARVLLISLAAALEQTIHPGETPPEDTVSNVVDVVVLRLRRKLGGTFIETVRGLGYRLDEPSAVGDVS